MLLVDDDRAILRVFSKIFEKKGYAVAVAETGREAEEKLEKRGFDATVLDLRLPDMNGVDLLPLMHELAPEMVKVVLTGLPLSDNYCEVAKVGADALLSKPVDPGFLLDVLEQKLREKKPQLFSAVL
jgi:two-component system nitrogen regulation response regulator GlnG